MMYKQVECPTCGNSITAKSAPRVQKCQFCRKLFTVDICWKGKKAIWDIKYKEFDTSTNAEFESRFKPYYESRRKRKVQRYGAKSYRR